MRWERHLRWGERDNGLIGTENKSRRDNSAAKPNRSEYQHKRQKEISEKKIRENIDGKMKK